MHRFYNWSDTLRGLAMGSKVTSIRRLPIRQSAPPLCFLSHSRDEYRVVFPFIKDGFDCGDRVFGHELPRVPNN